jgi:hypothetical protein
MRSWVPTMMLNSYFCVISQLLAISYRAELSAR